MSHQRYNCPEHGEFTIEVPFGGDIPEETECMTPVDEQGDVCIEPSPWVPSAPNFIGGPTTGARKG